VRVRRYLRFCARVCRAWHPLIQQCVGLLRTAHRPAADDAFELGVHDNVGQPQALTGQAPIGQRVAELGPRPIPPVLEFLDDQCEAALQSGRIETLLPVDRLVELLNPRRRDLQDPADVLSSHEMPRWPQDVRPEEVSAIELALRVGNREPGGAHSQ